MAYAQALFWTDFETTGLPNGNDFSGVHILEVAVVITNFDLQPITGYKEVIAMTKTAAEAIQANDYVKKMHTDNGLIAASVAAARSGEGRTTADVEGELLDLIRENTTFDKGEFMIAGSGVAAYDHPLIKAKMPRLAKFLAYYPFDIGVQRRTALILSGNRELVNPTPRSYQDGQKEHRAWDDVMAHIEEAKRWMEFYRSLP